MKDHYVPACYIYAGSFNPACRAEVPPYLWVVDLGKGKMRRPQPDNPLELTDYYAVGDGDDRYDVEKYLSAVESQTAPVLTRVLGDCQIIEPKRYKLVLSYFAALQIVRVPQFRERIEKFITKIGQTVNAMMIRSRDRYEEGLREAYPDRRFTRRGGRANLCERPRRWQLSNSCRPCSRAGSWVERRSKSLPF